MFIDRLRDIVDPAVQNNRSRVFDMIMQTCIIAGIVAFSLETLPDLSGQDLYLLHCIDAILAAIFSIEYILRIFVAKNRLRFIFSFYGIVDLLAILPFYMHVWIGTSLDLRSLRIVRMFRLVRVLKLLRYSRAIKRFEAALDEVRDELFLYLVGTFFLLFLAATGIYHFEHEAQPDQFKSVFHSLWWAVVTLTTVGYGDMYPITVGGRIFTGFILVLGLGLIAVPSGLLASGMTATRERQDRDRSGRSVHSDTAG